MVGATTAAISQFLPWTRIGTASRNSFSLLRAADRLGFIDGGIATFLYGLWFFMPLTAALAICSLAVDWTKTALALAAITVVVVGSVSVLLTKSRFPSLAGPHVGFAGLVITFVSCAGLVLASAVRRQPEGDRGTDSTTDSSGRINERYPAKLEE